MGATSLRESLRVLEAVRLRALYHVDNAQELELIDREIAHLQCELARVQVAGAMRRYVRRGLSAYSVRSRG